MKLIVAIWPTTISAAARRDQPERRVAKRAAREAACVGCRLRYDRRLAEERRTCERAAARQVPASAANAQPSPALSASGGRVSAATSPPRGTFAWRIPSASPRSDGREPMHHRPAARGVDTRAECAGRDEEEHELARSRDAIPTHASATADVDEPERKHDPLADAVGEEAPRQEGRCHPDPERREHDARLAEGEIELRRELGREHGDADRCRRHGRLCCRSDGEHHPAVSRSGHLRRYQRDRGLRAQKTHRAGGPRECQGRLTYRRSGLPVGRLSRLS